MDITIIGAADHALDQVAELVRATGHVPHMQNIISGPALFCVSASDGTTAATSARLSECTGVTLRLVAIVLTNADQVDDEDMLEMVEMEARDLLEPLAGKKVARLPRLAVPGASAGDLAQAIAAAMPQ